MPPDDEEKPGKKLTGMWFDDPKPVCNDKASLAKEKAYLAAMTERSKLKPKSRRGNIEHIRKWQAEQAAAKAVAGAKGGFAMVDLPTQVPGFDDAFGTCKVTEIEVDGNVVQVVAAADLHAFLQVKSKMNDWVKRRVSGCDLQLGVEAFGPKQGFNSQTRKPQGEVAAVNKGGRPGAVWMFPSKARRSCRWRSTPLGATWSGATFLPWSGSCSSA